MILYHYTTREAAAVLETGFRDSTGNFLTSEHHNGVWLSDRPADENEGADGSAVLRIT